MAKVTCDNGVVLHWDDTLSVGELITAYEKGYHILTGIDHREGLPPLARHVRVATARGALVPPRGEMVCDASYVKRLSRADIQRLYEDEVNAAITKRDNLLKFATG